MTSAAESQRLRTRSRSAGAHDERREPAVRAPGVVVVVEVSALPYRASTCWRQPSSIGETQPEASSGLAFSLSTS